MLLVCALLAMTSAGKLMDENTRRAVRAMLENNRAHGSQVTSIVDTCVFIIVKNRISCVYCTYFVRFKISCAICFYTITSAFSLRPGTNEWGELDLMSYQ